MENFNPAHLSKKHASARISWYEKYKEKTAYDWAQVMNQVLRLASSHEK